MKVAICAGYSSENQWDASIVNALRICREDASRQGLDGCDVRRIADSAPGLREPLGLLQPGPFPVRRCHTWRSLLSTGRRQ